MPMLDTNNVSGGWMLILYKYSPGIFLNTTLIHLIIIHKDRDMKITHSGYKTGIAILLAAMTALTLTGCAKSTAPSQNDTANKEVDDLFANLGDPKTPPLTQANAVHCVSRWRRTACQSVFELKVAIRIFAVPP
ncbi:hypothetical protein [Serratia marcescens]|uniref:hypothetical protein n=1 Tax=Serratia marcescens TaxID=615 RepID=UPI001D12F66A|nr:hypothetical protein [Serratia marcescens]